MFQHQTMVLPPLPRSVGKPDPDHPVLVGGNRGRIPPRGIDVLQAEREPPRRPQER